MVSMPCRCQCCRAEIQVYFMIKRASILVFAVVLPILLLFLALGELAVNVPYWDDYGAIVRYMGWPFAERMQHLFDFHNEHRIVTVRLFLEAMVAITGKVNFKACMIFGSAQLIVILGCFAWFQFGHFGRRLGFVLLAAASWHLLSLMNFDNAFWALTALENFGVLMWAFLAIVLFSIKERSAFRLLGWLCALMAVFTGAQGLAVLGVLCVIAIVPSGDGSRNPPGTWKEFLHQVLKHLRKPVMLCGAVMSVAIAILVVSMYFRGFQHGDVASAASNAAVFDRVLYILAFLGNVVPIYPVALVFGCAMTVAIAFIMFRFPRLPIRLRPIFFFMIYLVGVAVAGVAFRGTEPRAALSFRYYVITACLFVSVTMFLVELLGQSSLAVRLSIPMLVAGFALLDLAVFFVGWPMFAERNEALRVNILTWPEDLNGLRIDDEHREQASRDLRDLEQSGRYDHNSLLREGESMPRTPIPWPAPKFP